MLLAPSSHRRPSSLSALAIISHSTRIAICNSVCSRLHARTRSHTVSTPYDCDAVLTHPCPPTRVLSLLVSAPISPSPSHPQESLFNAASIRTPDRLLGSALLCLCTLKHQPLPSSGRFPLPNTVASIRLHPRAHHSSQISSSPAPSASPATSGSRSYDCTIIFGRLHRRQSTSENNVLR
ncbi:hypothetical protein OH76DRAFT_1397670 [Lentinus brumalis]|uniref:Uncharacterized protein n=1 Tax=Lentinus brumalis TaxID=2498619 RepID=A0A371DRV2_9APHY|nr:hypothetical protein OH76DRAFT_1397670 [Polyporus brumalis]